MRASFARISTRPLRRAVDRVWRRLRPRDLATLAQLARTRAFDSAFYAREYPDVARSRVPPLLHFVRRGASEGRKPNPWFDTAYYLGANPDVRAAGVNPLLHYVLHGRGEGRAPGPVPETPSASSRTQVLEQRAVEPAEDELAVEDPSAIHVLHFEIVQSCQLRCLGCPITTLLPKIEKISPALFARCLSNIDVPAVRDFNLFNYGEPLLHDDLPAIAEIVAKSPLQIGSLEISTNAQFARWDQIEAVVAMRVLNRFIVSCDGDGTPESYERLRPPGKWSVLMDFLRRLAEIRAKHDPDLQLVTRTIITSGAHRESWRAILEPLGWSSDFRGWKILPEALNQSERVPVPGTGVCRFLETPGQHLYVNVDGTVVPCCAHPGAGDLGSLAMNTFREILSGSKRNAFVETMRTARSTMPVCSGCEWGPTSHPGPSDDANVPIA
jgi:radical SAM protein with 4Fe4S-binding SPASM domain